MRVNRTSRPACSSLRWLPALLAVSLTMAGEEPAAPTANEPLTLEAYPVQQQPAEAAPPSVELFPGSFDYQIGRQDLLQIDVFGVDEMDQIVRVADDGSITMPLLGRLQIAGLTKSQVESLIAQQLAARFVRDPQVTVFIKEYQSKRVAVSGAVRSPGTFEMLGRKTLLEMISMAGGLTGDIGHEIIIFRPTVEGRTERLRLDLDRLVYEADPSLNLVVGAGDIIYIPTVEKIRIFVTGAVKSPDVYEIARDEPITVLRAVTMAGGTTDRAAEKRVRIMRTDANGQRVTLEVNLKRIKQGKIEDPLLQEDDIILVPEAFF